MKLDHLFYFCDGIGSVFDSQVLALLNGIKEKDQFKKIILFLGIRDKNRKTDLLKKTATAGIEIVFFKSFPNYPFFNFLIQKSIKTALISQGTDLNKALFHTRGELIAWHLSKILGSKYQKKIIPDVRGASIEEINEFYDSNKFSKYVKIVNYRNAAKYLTNFHKISVVSESLGKYLISNYNVEQERIVINPSLAGSDFQFNDTQRKYIRQEFNLSYEDLLIVFTSGGTANWQNNEVLIMLAEKGLKVLNLSKKEVNHKNIINKFVGYSDMNAYLNASDVAIIWREKSIVNKVASPVKFSEYVCSGLPVIANDSVDMIRDYIAKYDCGLLVENLDNLDVNKLKDLKQKKRKLISESGILNFGLNKVVNKYLKTYSSINTQ